MASMRPSLLKLSSSSIAAIKKDEILWYKVRVLVYDLYDTSKDPASETRIQTTNELYLSHPYFTISEAERVKAAIVEVTEATLPDAKDTVITHTIEQAFKSRFSGFQDKRRASGDSRPCGPHDLGPVYMSVLSISQVELRDEKFLARLGRSGVGYAKAEISSGTIKERGGQKNGKKKKDVLPNI